MRLTLRNGGYDPIPVFGKAPAPNAWQTLHGVSPEQMEMWGKTWPGAVNTGILTRDVPTLDVDILNPEASEAIEEMVKAHFEDFGHVMVRIGLAPKRAYPFRTDAPFAKITINFEGTDQKLEFLGRGQQVVVDGIHPDTSKPYAWFNGEPASVRRSELPLITEAEARELMERAAEILVAEYGYVRGGSRPKEAQANGAEGASDWGYLVERIRAGEKLHDSIRDLAAKLVKSGMDGGAAVNFLRGVMEQMPEAARNARWHARYNDIPRQVSTAEKFRGSPSPEMDFSELLKNGRAKRAEAQAKAQQGNSGTGPTGWTYTPPPPTTYSATPYVWTNPEDIPLRDWLYGRLLVRRFVSLTAAPGGTGKSSLIVAETVAQAAGKDLLGVTPKDRLRVWLFNLEDPQEETRRKIQATAKHYRLQPEDLGNRLFVDSGRDRPLVVAKMTRDGAMIVRPMIEALVAEIIDKQIDIVVIDPFVSCHEVPENDNSAQDMVAKEWGKVADRGNCAVHLIDHTRKAPAGAEVTTESTRGGKAKTDAARVVRVVNQMSKDEGKKAGVENHRLFFRTYNDKANLAPPADKSDWFKLTGVDLGNGPVIVLGGVSFATGDDVGVVTKWEWPNALDGVTGGDFDKAAAAIRAGEWKHSPQAGNWVGYAVAEALGLGDVTERGPARTKVIALLKVWLETGALVKVKRYDPERRETKDFVEVAPEPDD